MPTTLNKEAYDKLIDEDIEWLLTNTKDSLERQHIIDILKWVKLIRPETAKRHEIVYGRKHAH